jgi:hypothetical protein
LQPHFALYDLLLSSNHCCNCHKACSARLVTDQSMMLIPPPPLIHVSLPTHHALMVLSCMGALRLPAYSAGFHLLSQGVKAVALVVETEPICVDGWARVLWPFTLLTCVVTAPPPPMTPWHGAPVCLSCDGGRLHIACIVPHHTTRIFLPTHRFNGAMHIMTSIIALSCPAMWLETDVHV